MKVFLGFYGLVHRSLKYTYESIEKNIINVLKENNIDYDLYIHTFDNKTSNTKWGKIEEEIPINIDDIKLFNTNNISISNEDYFNNKYDFKKLYKNGDIWKNNFSSLHNAIRELYSIKELYKMINSDYDLYIFTRADLFFENKLDINFILTNFKNNILFTLPYGKCNGNINDLLTICDKDSIKIIANRLDFCVEYVENGYIFWTEGLLKYLVDKFRINVIDMNLYCYRVRANGNLMKQY